VTDTATRPETTDAADPRLGEASRVMWPTGSMAR
jgi:hypothetical protein